MQDLSINIFKRKDDENIKQYKIRLFENMKTYGLTYENIANLINKETGQEFNESTYRKWYKPYKEGFEDAKKKYINISESEFKAQESVEKAKIQTEKTEMNRWIREHARDELFYEKVVKAIKETKLNDIDIHIVPIEPQLCSKCGVLAFADAHFGKEFTIHGMHNEVINQYNPEIFYQRMDTLLRKTIEIVHRENLNQIKVLSLGDSLEGFLRNSQIWTLRYGVVDSAIIYGKYIAKWLKELSKEVRVEYHQTCGNHCELRLLDGKKGEHAHENIEKIIATIIEVYNDDNPNFTIVENKTGLIYTDAVGYNILGIHGETKNLANAIKDFSEFYNIKIDYIYAGHYHHANFNNCGCRKGAIGIGSVMGSDNYSAKLLRKADATASFIIFEENIGKTIEYTIVLD